VLGVFTLVYCTNIADRYVLSVLIEPIRAEFGLSDSALGFLSGFAFAIFYTVLGLPIARLADRSNRRNIVAAATVVFSVMTALCGMAQSFVLLVLARIGVAVGEAGATPPAHSIIADLFERHQRALALAIFSLGASAGLTLGMTFGGWVAEHHGWRFAFLSLAVPGLLVAGLVRLTVKEPIRTHSDNAPSQATLAETVRFMLSQRALVHVFVGGALLNAYLVGLSIFLPALLVRSQGYTVGEAGQSLGIILGVSGSIGLLAGGYLTDKLGKRDLRWHVWLTALVTVISFPATIALLFVGKSLVYVLCASMFGVANSLFLGPLYAMTQNLVPTVMRAFAAAVLLFCINIIGMGFGPQIVGGISDALNSATALGEDSLQYALLVTVVITAPWSVFHYWRASVHLREDYKRVE